MIYSAVLRLRRRQTIAFQIQSFPWTVAPFQRLSNSVTEGKNLNPKQVEKYLYSFCRQISEDC